MKGASGENIRAKLIKYLKKVFTFSVKKVSRGRLCDRTSHRVLGQEDIFIVRTLNHGNMTYLHERMTYSKSLYVGYTEPFFFAVAKDRRGGIKIKF